jgi:hypothetical protein
MNTLSSLVSIEELKMSMELSQSRQHLIKHQHAPLKFHRHNHIQSH